MNFFLALSSPVTFVLTTTTSKKEQEDDYTHKTYNRNEILYRERLSIVRSSMILQFLFDFFPDITLLGVFVHRMRIDELLEILLWCS